MTIIFDKKIKECIPEFENTLALAKLTDKKVCFYCLGLIDKDISIDICDDCFKQKKFLFSEEEDKKEFEERIDFIKLKYLKNMT